VNAQMRSGEGVALKAPVRILVVEDSPTARQLLVTILESDGRFKVIGEASDGEAAVRAAAQLRPDLVTMDIHLPVQDGFAATRQIMETCPTRIVMVTSTALPHEAAASFRALESGALTVLAKPMGPLDPLFAATREELCRTVALMSEVPVVRRWPAERLKRRPRPHPVVAHPWPIRLVAVGASTGGPLALQALLSVLRRGFDAPMVVVQHISTGFADGLAQWLSSSSGHPVCVATHGEAARSGMVYLAPDGAHLEVDSDLRLVLRDSPPEFCFRPAVGPLFRSVAAQVGAASAGLLLTGMGHDGAHDLKLMRESGALTMAQDSASAAVYGMPGEALRLDAAAHVLSPEAMADALNRLISTTRE